MSRPKDPFHARSSLETSSGTVTIYRLDRLAKRAAVDLGRLPYSIRVLLEAVLRQCDGFQIREEDVTALAGWRRNDPGSREVPFKPARVVMQDFTGVPAVVDLAALRSATVRLGGDPRRINPLIPVDLVIDHSVQVDRYGSPEALAINARREFERNRERYEFLRWGSRAFERFRVVPPATGIIHQVNLEYLAAVVACREEGGETLAFPDSLVGTDSHTTMINGLGVVGWGVGGIEAEAAMLGQPLYMLPPEVVGLELTGELREGATATDLVLTVTQTLRRHGVVGKFVEFFGEGLARLTLADRATLSNMAPEYGATMGFFPVDGETLRYLRASGRPAALVDLVERYTKEQGLYRTGEAPDPEYTEVVKLDMSAVEPSIAGPRRPQDRVSLPEAKRSFWTTLGEVYGIERDSREPAPAGAVREEREDMYRRSRVSVRTERGEATLAHGSVVIAAITSCTNTSNPPVMVAAGLLARKAAARGLTVPPHVKTSLAPGSRVVTRYLKSSGLLEDLEKLGFHVVGYGCTTCIGNSGPLPEEISRTVREKGLIVASVLSGNRNFEGRVNPDTRANYLASPPLVVAYALAGTVDIDFATEPIGRGRDGLLVYLRDLWPGQDEVRLEMERSVRPELFHEEYADVFAGSEEWQNIASAAGEIYAWDPSSTYIREPEFFADLTPLAPPIGPIRGARVLALLGDTVTTDHISPAGAIPADSPAGRYLIEKGITPQDFNSYGSRRGNHEVMVRGTFANIRLRNRLVPGVEGGFTVHFPSGERLEIFDAAMRYRREGTPLLVVAGREYGTGSSRDWAAKGTQLLGVRAVLAESYERIHRSNLIGMGVLPLQFLPGESAASLSLEGTEVYDIEGLDDRLAPGQEVTVRVRGPRGTGERTFRAVARVDSAVEVEYYRHGGILHAVLRSMVAGGVSAQSDA